VGGTRFAWALRGAAGGERLGLRPGTESRALILGADIGQAVDPSTIAVLEGFAVRHVERVPLETPYPVVADRIAAVARAAGAAIAVDSTGGGRAVVDLLRERGFTPIAVTLHGGKVVRRTANGISIPRHAFFRPLEAAVQQGRLEVAGRVPRKRIAR
jgi:hypothetical protein